MPKTSKYSKICKCTVMYALNLVISKRIFITPNIKSKIDMQMHIFLFIIKNHTKTNDLLSQKYRPISTRDEMFCINVRYFIKSILIVLIRPTFQETERHFQVSRSANTSNTGPNNIK